MPVDRQIAGGSGDCARFSLDSDLRAVRDGLQRLLACDFLAQLTNDSRGTVEIVLAEALNNVVEHACRDLPGKVAVELCRRDPDLQFEICDHGQPMPGTEPPIPPLPWAVPISELPEGGFGWFLIRSLTHSLTYCRQQDRNLLHFCVTVNYDPTARSLL